MRIHPMIVLALVIMLLPTFPVTASDAGEGETFRFDFSPPLVSVGDSGTEVTMDGLDAPIMAGRSILPIDPVMLDASVEGLEVILPEPVVLGRYPMLRVEDEFANGDGTVIVPHVGEERPVEVVGTMVKDGRPLLSVNLRPVVQQADGTLLYYPWIELKAESKAEGRAISCFPCPASPTVEYVIITSDEMLPAFTTLAEWKEARELDPVREAEVIAVEDILDDQQFWGDPFSHGGKGNDSQTIIRNFISHASRDWGARYFLLGGDDSVIPSRYVTVRVDFITEAIPTDLYYSALDGDWDADGDGDYGESDGAMGDEADLLSEVFVGRAPVSTPQEASAFVAKVIAFEGSAHEDQVLLVGQRLCASPLTWGGDYSDMLFEGEFPSTYGAIRLYERDDTFSSSSLVQAIGNGTDLVCHVGHGDVDQWADLDPLVIRSMDNLDPFVLYSQACLIGAYDRGDSIVEALIGSDHAAVAALANTRYGWYQPGSTEGESQMYEMAFFHSVFTGGWWGLGEALVASRETLASQTSDPIARWTYFAMNLFGDPEMSIGRSGDVPEGVAVLDAHCEEALLGQVTEVTCNVTNWGDDMAVTTVELVLEGVTVASSEVPIGSGCTVKTVLEWTPLTWGMQQLIVTCHAENDQDPWDDSFPLPTVVDWPIWGETEVEGEHIDLDCRMLVHGDLTVISSTIDMSESGAIVVDGNASFSQTVLLGGELRFEEGSGGLITASSLEGASLISQGDIAIGSTTLHGCEGIVLIGNVSLANTTFVSCGNASFGCCVTITGTSFIDGGEVILENATGEVRSLVVSDSIGLTLSGCEGMALEEVTSADNLHGLLVRNSTSLSLQHIDLTGNGDDLGVSGDDILHFVHDVVDCSLSDGELAYLVGEEDLILSRSSMNISCAYLVSCRNIEMMGMDLRNVATGCMVLASSNVTLRNNLFIDDRIGLEIRDSSSISVFHNDFILNDVHAIDDSGSVFNLPYPEGGNHWSGHESPDVASGPAQGQEGGDGIVDTPYFLLGGVDMYPMAGSCNILNSTPVAAFAMSSWQPYSLDPVEFTDLSHDPDGVIVSHQWDFGDGTSSNISSPDHAYQRPGEYMVVLRVEDNRGLTSSAMSMIEVINLPPEAVIAPPQALAAEAPLSFSDRSVDRDGEITSWQWDLGDGSVASGRNVSHTYATKGVYEVTLTVTDDLWGIGTISISVVIDNVAPRAVFGHPVAPIACVGTQFTDLSNDPDGEIVSWYWEFGDGQTSRERSPIHAYDGMGTYKVILTVTDDHGFRTEAQKWLQIGNSPPEARISHQLEGNMLHLSDASVDMDGTIVVREWRIGDQVIRSEDAYCLLSKGETNVTLEVWDDAGDTSSASLVLSLETEASVSITPEISPEGDSRLTCVATGCDPLSYLWDLGQGDVVAGQVVECSFPPGDHIVRVKAFLVDGTVLETSVAIDVLGIAPTSIIGYSMLSSTTIRLEDLSTDVDNAISGREWSVDGVPIGTSVVMVHELPVGIHTISLEVWDDYGLSSTSSLSLGIHTPNVMVEDINREGGLSFAVRNICPVEMEYVVRVSTSGTVVERNLTIEGGGSETVTIETFSEREGVSIEVIAYDEVIFGVEVEGDEGSPWAMVVIPLAAIALLGAGIFRRRR